jgi:hypothetical protein
MHQRFARKVAQKFDFFGKQDVAAGAQERRLVAFVGVVIACRHIPAAARAFVIVAHAFGDTTKRRALARHDKIADMYAGHLDLTQPLMWTVDAALSAEECASYVLRMRAGQAEVAPIDGRSGPTIDLETRNNTRVMWDDAQEANALLQRVSAHVPQRLSGQQRVGANPRLRLYRYAPGERHGAHWDTVVELADGVRSLLTLVFYLNDGFGGGATDFPELSQRVVPQRGRALLFQHRVLHEAMAVTAGEKFVLRTDVLYQALDR